MLVNVIARNVLLEGKRLEQGVQEVADNRVLSLLNAGVAIKLVEEVNEDEEVIEIEVELEEAVEEKSMDEVKAEAKELGINIFGKKHAVIRAEVLAKQAE